jgi:hypothetical protein
MTDTQRNLIVLLAAILGGAVGALMLYAWIGNLR